MIIDAHTHVYPDSVAKKAIAGSPADLPRFGDGTVDSLLDVMAKAGVDRSINLGVANSADRVENANRFAGSLDPEHFIAFGSIHPDLPPEENVASLRKYGLKGAKVHPMFQDLRLDDHSLLATLEAMAGEFAVIIHVGAAGEDPGDRCTPSMVVDIAKQLPDLAVIACHFGGYRRFDEASRIVIGSPVYVDTSWPPGLGSLPQDEVRAVIDRHGADRVIFASDWPMADPAAEIATLRALGLPPDETDAILGGNVAQILGIES